MTKPTGKAFIGILLLLAFFSACATKSQAPEEAVPCGDLKKKVVVAPFYNATGQDLPYLNGDFLSRFTEEFLSDCDGVSLIRAEDLTGAVLRHQGSASGLVRPGELLARARQYGANAIVTGSLAGLLTRTEKRGIYGFREPMNVTRVTLHVWVYQTLTGAKLLDKSMEKEFVSDPGLGGTGVSEAQVNQALEDMARQAGLYACRSTRHIPWRGFIRSVEGDTVTLAAGRDAGLAPGNILFVHKGSEVITGIGGQKFCVPGEAVGTVRVTEVSDATSRARVVSGGPYTPEDWVAEN